MIPTDPVTPEPVAKVVCPYCGRKVPVGIPEHRPARGSPFLRFVSRMELRLLRCDGKSLKVLGEPHAG